MDFYPVVIENDEDKFPVGARYIQLWQFQPGNFCVHKLRSDNTEHLPSICRVESHDDLKIVKLSSMRTSMPNTYALIELYAILQRDQDPYRSSETALSVNMMERLAQFFGNERGRFWENLETDFGKRKQENYPYMILPKEVV